MNFLQKNGRGILVCLVMAVPCWLLGQKFPIVGGPVFGILAGMLHFTLVTSVPLLHGGFCLYNGGFTAAFVCMFFIPVFEHFFRTKEERRLAKAERTANSQ